MKKYILLLILFFIGTLCFSQQESGTQKQKYYHKFKEIRKAKNPKDEFEIYISYFPGEFVVNIDFEDYRGAEVSVFDTLGNLLTYKTVGSRKTRVYFKKLLLNGNTFVFILVRSTNYIIREKHEI